MNDNAARLARADAFFLVVDRKSARGPSAVCQVRNVLHDSQVGLFEEWQNSSSEFPILIIGQIWPRGPRGGRTLVGLPMVFCRDVKAVRRYVRGFDQAAASDPLELVKASAFLILLSDRAQATAVKAIISEIEGRRQ
jgi:hypothetical protein